MYISRVEIDTNNRSKIKDLTHVGAYHNWVERSFPFEITASVRTRKLWRVDRIAHKNYLIVVSEEKPDAKSVEQYGVEGSFETKRYDPFINSMSHGDKMRFRVVLNPVITLSKGKGNRGAVKPHITVEHQMKFLIDRSEKNGFHLNPDEFFIVERGYSTLNKENQSPINFIKVVYEGLLTISDPEIFRHTLTEGFGKHRAYGFGLMTVMPVSTACKQK